MRRRAPTAGAGTRHRRLSLILVVLGAALAWTLPAAAGAAIVPTAPLTFTRSASVDPPMSAGVVNGAGSTLSDLTCPSTGLCLAVGPAEIASSTDPTGGQQAWNVVSVDPGHQITAISCPTTSLCIAIDNTGTILTSTDPGGPASAWSLTLGPDAAGGQSCAAGTYQCGPAIACASASLCVVVERGTVWSSTDPAGGSAAWTPATLPVGDASLVGVACPSEQLCVAVASGLSTPGGNVSPIDVGELFTTTDPTGGASAWTAAQVGSHGALSSVSCPSASFCAADGPAGDIAVSTDPAGGASTWVDTAVVKTNNTPVAYDPASCSKYMECPTAPNALDTIACASAAFCVAYGPAAYFTSADPAQGAWTAGPVGVNLATLGSDRAACPSSTLCLFLGQNRIFASTTPAGGPGETTAADTREAFVDALACPSATTCLAVDGQGNVAYSTAATTPGAHWSLQHIDAVWSGLTAISCPSVSFCAAVDSSGNLLTSAAPTSGQPWAVATISQSGLTAIACPTASLCVAGTGDGALLTSVNPTGGRAAWAEQSLNPNVYSGTVTGIDCPSTNLCVAIDYDDMYTSTDPAVGIVSWHQSASGHDSGLLHGLSCISATWCMALDNFGHLRTTRNPGAPEPTWASSRIALDGDVDDVSLACTPNAVCAATDGGPYVVASADPASGPSAWIGAAIPPAAPGGLASGLSTVACPSAAACVAFDETGEALVGTQAPAPGPRRSPGTSALSCGCLAPRACARSCRPRRSASASSRRRRGRCGSSGGSAGRSWGRPGSPTGLRSPGGSRSRSRAGGGGGCAACGVR